MAEGAAGAGEEVVLHGGVANAGAVVRVGDHVLRPAPANTEAIHALLGHLRANGFDGVPEPVGLEPDGRERLTYLDGDVPIPPYPDWAQTDDALASIAALLRRYHEAVAGFVAPPGVTWNRELADPAGEGPLLCHNDVCPENVVFRDGVAVALLDFEFAAPGRASFDLGALASMCIPVSDPEARARLGWRTDGDLPGRLRLVADAYGCDAAGRAELLDVLTRRVATGGQFVLARVQAGDPGFVAMWESMGGMAAFDRRRAWFAEIRDTLAAALA